MSSSRSVEGDTPVVDRPAGSDECAQCGRDWDDHTLRELREHHPARDLKLPFDDSGSDVIMTRIPGLLVSTAVARAAVIELPATGPVPALCLSFLDANGLAMAAEVTLPLPEKEMKELGKLLVSTIEAATLAARREREKS